MAASSNPFLRGSRGWGTLVHQNHGTVGGNGSIMVGMFVCLCLVSKKPSKRELFVLSGTDLGVKLLKDIQSTSRVTGRDKTGRMGEELIFVKDINDFCRDRLYPKEKFIRKNW